MADVVVKVNFPPYLLVLDLHAAVDDATAVASFEGTQLSLVLAKATPGDWPDLQATGGRSEVAARREASIAAKQARELELVDTKKQRRAEDGRAALRKQVHGPSRGC